MKLHKILLLLVLPLTLVLDLILYGFIKTCPTCGNFWQFLESEGALSFPIVVGITEWLTQIFPKSLKSPKLPKQ